MCSRGAPVAQAELQALAEELCRVFLGWKLGGDHDVLLALEEGELAIDVLSGECSCNGDPIPPLNIAGELTDFLLRALERDGVPRATVSEASVEALFARSRRRSRGRVVPILRLACRSRVAAGDTVAEAEANNG